MSARILVVDDSPLNVKIMEARLTAEYFDVLTASSGAEALEIVSRTECDLILLDAIMPGMDGFETCRRLKTSKATYFIPIAMVTALDSVKDRVRALEAGADDFLSKPVSDVLLMARVRSLTRLKLMTDELRMRSVTTLDVGLLQGAEFGQQNNSGTGGRILLVEDRPDAAESISNALTIEHKVDVEPDPALAILHAGSENYDLLIISLGLKDFDGLRLCSQARSLDRTRHVPILAITEAEDSMRLLRGLDIGVNDYLMRPVEGTELLARVRTQIRRRRYTDNLRDYLQASFEHSITDALTGLSNRRYMEGHLNSLALRAVMREQPVSLMMIDIDHFKSINDTYGHHAGDEVLRQFALRLRKSIRGIDLPARFGGEEFVVVMPETQLSVAQLVAERVRRTVAGDPFVLDDKNTEKSVTISIGIASVEPGEEIAATLKRADMAMYRAKMSGRNRVELSAA